MSRKQYGRTQDLAPLEIVGDCVVRSPHGTAVILELVPHDLTLEPVTKYTRALDAFRQFCVSLHEPIQLYVRKQRYSIDDFVGYLQGRLEVEAQNPDPRLHDLGLVFADYVGKRDHTEAYYRTTYYAVIWSMAGGLAVRTEAGNALRAIPFLGDLLANALGAGKMAAATTALDSAVVDQLVERARSVASSLERCEIKARLLARDELLALFAEIFQTEQLAGRPVVSTGHLAPVTLWRDG